MAGVNKVIILGNLGQDPEIHEMKSGTQVCRLNVATTRKWKSKDTNEQVEETEWHRISVWGPQAEPCKKYLSKGRQVYVEGRLRTSSYEKDGVKKLSTEIVADTVQFIGGRNDGGSQGGGGAPPRDDDYDSSGAAPGSARGGPDDDDIPF